MIDGRSAGVLAHVTSLPGRLGLGDLGPGAVRFLDWAKDAGFAVWQVLPLHPAGAGNSPYDSRSAFAGNPLLLSADDLVRDGLLTAAPLDDPAHDAGQVHYHTASRAAARRLRAAWARFRSAPSAELAQAFDAFVADPLDRYWLDDWATYAALRHVHRGRAWPDWDEDLRLRRPAALANAARALAAEIDFERFAQFLFRRQWVALREAMRERGIRVFGDVPFYVALDSADTWAHRELFAIDERGRPTRVGGVPPDAFSATGQRWGQPVYEWDRMAEDRFAWWVARVRAELRLYDLLRLDHFRGFAAYWEIPADAATAEPGRWVGAPGHALLQAITSALGAAPFVAEDLGVITPDVAALRDAFDLPGLHVAQFALGEDAAQHRLTGHRENGVVCTGTHDMDPLRGWLDGLDPRSRERVFAEIGASPERGAAALVEWVYRSPCALAILPLQDVLGLGREARMNLPGTAHGNWTWRARAAQLTAERSAEALRLARASGRAGG